ncbi:MAG: tRNA (adenosine(37)-N6)-dimethylallyltransferase MiaA [candidate division KSB1 bacterium]|jgi:tRNA dimethylallyltransferase|nr:tRNA (adenosine(37)-N6)-dimethylallyltransferase MiaA [candidate division KSB1 bacterium]
MEEKRDNPVAFIIGPTAVGKTHLSLKISEKHDIEIISADSRQIYKYMDIGTAKPTHEELKSVPHHFIDIKFPDEYYSAGKFGKEARSRIDDIIARDKIPLVVGGAGFYIKALAEGLFEAEIHDAQVKQKLQEEVRERGLAALYERLIKVDPQSSARLHANDKQRILRALEVWEISRTPLSKYHQEDEVTSNFNAVYFGLTTDRSLLYRRIEERVDDMISDGLIEEVTSIMEKGYSEDLSSLQTVGYKEVFQYIHGALSRDDMIALIKQNSRNYAKRQMTWFRKNKEIAWYDIHNMECFNKVISDIETFFNKYTFKN